MFVGEVKGHGTGHTSSASDWTFQKILLSVPALSPRPRLTKGLMLVFCKTTVRGSERLSVGLSSPLSPRVHLGPAEGEE